MHKPLKVLYVAMKSDYGDPARGLSYEHCNFYDVLAHMGVDILYFDFMQLLREHGRDLMNERLREIVDEEKPDILFSVLYKNEIKMEVMRDISENTDTVTVNWFCDDHWRFKGFSSRWATVFNHIATTDKASMNGYRRLGAQNVHSVQWACNPFMYRKRDLPLLHDVTFVGQPHGSRRAIVQKLQDAGIAVKAWGNGWEAGRLTQEEMIAVFTQSRINLNFTDASTKGASLFRRKNPAQIKGRNFEVPGCGGFMLTGPAEHLEECYIPGKEIVIAKSTEDMVRLCAYYLSHEDERAAIAKAGYERTMREHTYVHRFCDLFTAMGFSMETPESILAGKNPQGKTVEVRMKNTTPLVSIVMPVYNGEELVRESIRSMRDQTFTDFELIIVDDGSSKPLTLSILEEEAADDPRIRIIHQKNQGKGGARNTGSRAAKGAYVAIMDQDDIALPHRLAVQVAYMEQHPEVGAVGSWGELIDAEGKVFGHLRHSVSPGAVRFAMLMKNPVLNSTGLIRREKGESIGWYRDLPAEDYDFWARASRAFPVANIPEVLLQYRKWDGAYTASSTDVLEASSVPIMQEGAEALLGKVSVDNVIALRKTIAGHQMTAVDCMKASAFLRRVQRAYLHQISLKPEERRFVRHCTSEWLCVFAGRLRATGALGPALRVFGAAFLIAPLRTIQTLLGQHPSLLQSEQPQRSLRTVLHDLLRS